MQGQGAWAREKESLQLQLQASEEERLGTTVQIDALQAEYEKHIAELETHINELQGPNQIDSNSSAPQGTLTSRAVSDLAAERKTHEQERQLDCMARERYEDTPCLVARC